MNIRKLTFEYVSAEDRIQLFFEDESRSKASIWLTQRLLTRLLPLLLQLAGWAEPDTPEVSALGAPLQRSRVGTTVQPPDGKKETAVVADTGTPSWLAVTAEISKRGDGVRIVFADGHTSRAALMLAQHELNGVLEFMSKLWRRAEWSTAVWTRVGGPLALEQPMQMSTLH